MANSAMWAHANYLDGLSTLSIRSFHSTEEAFQAVLELITSYLGLRTSFLTEITYEQDLNHIIAVYNEPGGCNVPAGADLPLSQTF
jgi:hypothetical protein